MKALVSPASFGNPDYPAVIAKLAAVPGYRAQFEKAFPGQHEPVTPENWASAIGAYERTLVSPSPFDTYLRGDTSALDARAQSGLRKFMDLGCAGCHDGTGVGGG